MFDSGGWIPYLAVIVLAYITFVFISESLNPFTSKQSKDQRRLKLAKSLALILFLLATIALIVEPYLGVSRSQLALAVAALCTFFALKPLYKYSRSTKRSISPSLISAEHQLQLEISKPDNDVKLDIPVQDANLDDVDPTSNLDDIDPITKLNALDQAVANADLTNADLTLSETSESAHARRSTLTDNINDISELSADLSYEDSLEHSDTKSPSAIESIIRMMDSQNEQKSHLSNQNDALNKDCESLTDEILDSKISQQTSNTITPNDITQQERAIKLKNNSDSTLTTMGIKKHKLTKIKAQKALLKMSTSESTQ